EERIASHAMQIAEERLLVPSKPEDAERNWDADVNADHPGIAALRELAREVSAFGVDRGAIGKAAVIHDLQSFFEAVHPLDAEHGSEDLFPSARHVFGNVVEDGGADEVALLAPLRHFRVASIENEFGAFVDCSLDPPEHEILLTLVTIGPWPVFSSYAGPRLTYFARRTTDST